MSPPPKLSRRQVTLGGIALAAAAAVAGAVYEVPRLFKHRATGEYADLVNLLDEPDQAAVVGRAVQDDSIKEEAAGLRATLKDRRLVDVLDGDLAQARLAEADGWVLPQTLATLCALAAA